MNTAKKVRIGEAIRKQRKIQGLTLNELGERMGISGSLVGQYERGVVNPKYETIIRFAEALDVPPRELLGSAFSDIVVPEARRLCHEYGDAAEVRVYDSGEVIAVTMQELLDEAFEELNSKGQKEAVKRVRELAQIPQYKRQKEVDSDTESKDD